MEITLSLPVAFSVRDYHEFQSHRDVLQRLHPDLLVQEVGTGIHLNGGPTVYWGLVCLKGQTLWTTDITSCLEQAGFDFRRHNKLEFSERNSEPFRTPSCPEKG